MNKRHSFSAARKGPKIKSNGQLNHKLTFSFIVGAFIAYGIYVHMQKEDKKEQVHSENDKKHGCSSS